MRSGTALPGPSASAHRASLGCRISRHARTDPRPGSLRRWPPGPLRPTPVGPCPQPSARQEFALTTTTIDRRPSPSPTDFDDMLGAVPLSDEILTGASTIDWPRIKRSYVEGIPRCGEEGDDPAIDWPSMRTLAQLTDVSESWLRGRASREGWAQARRDWQRTVEEARQHARAASAARHAATLDEAAVQAALDGLALVQRRLDTMEEAVDGRVLEALAKAATVWHGLGQAALGLDKVIKVEADARVDHSPSVPVEMRRDDPNRLNDFFLAVERCGLLGPVVGEESAAS